MVRYSTPQENEFDEFFAETFFLVIQLEHDLAQGKLRIDPPCVAAYLRGLAIQLAIRKMGIIPHAQEAKEESVRKLRELQPIMEEIGYDLRQALACRLSVGLPRIEDPDKRKTSAQLLRVLEGLPFELP